MLLSAVSVLVVAQSSSEIPEGLMNNLVYTYTKTCSPHEDYRLLRCDALWSGINLPIRVEGGD